MLVLSSPAFCLPFLSRSPRCVLRNVPSGCPLPSPACTPFQAVCEFCGFGPVAHSVCAACPLRVCALMHPRCTRSPPWSWCRVVPAQGAGRAVPCGSDTSAIPALVPCSVYLGRVWAGSPGPRIPLPGSGLRFAPLEFRLGRSGGHWGRGLQSSSSVPLPPLHRHQGWLPLRCIGHGGCGLHTALVRVRVLLPECRPRGAPQGGLVRWQATGGPNRQVSGSVTPRLGPVTSPQACVLRLADVMGEAGG